MKLLLNTNEETTIPQNFVNLVTVLPQSSTNLSELQNDSSSNRFFQSHDQFSQHNPRYHMLFSDNDDNGTSTTSTTATNSTHSKFKIHINNDVHSVLESHNHQQHSGNFGHNSNVTSAILDAFHIPNLLNIEQGTSANEMQHFTPNSRQHCTTDYRFPITQNFMNNDSSHLSLCTTASVTATTVNTPILPTCTSSPPFSSEYTGSSLLMHNQNRLLSDLRYSGLCQQSIMMPVSQQMEQSTSINIMNSFNLHNTTRNTNNSTMNAGNGPEDFNWDTIV
ncbi:unnamed protein product [Heterobilharzia americana]|nr:unnamed protein product [Heterobilharzia americana]